MIPIRCSARASLVTAVFLSLILGWAPVRAQSGTAKRAYIQIDGGTAARLPLAMPSFRIDAGAPPADSEQIFAVVERDLQLSGYFVLMDPAAFVEAADAGLKPGEFPFENWRLPGAVGLVKAAVSVDEQQLHVELYVYDVDAGVLMLARRISGDKGDSRRLAHHVSNAIVEAFTGTPGVFDTQLVAVANYGSGKEIYVFDYDGANPRPVSKNGSINLAPAFSPDGTKVSYTSYRDNNPDLWVTDLSTGRHKKVSAHPGINAGAEWAPDGQSMALTLSKDGDSEIYLIEPSGSIISRLTHQWGIDVSPTFSPDGKTLAFVSNREGEPQIFLMDRDGENVRRLTHLGGHNVSPAFSPDGQRLVFAGRDEGRFDLFSINIDGTGLRRLTQNNADDEDPSFSPDGQHILFSSSRGGRGKQLYIMTADGDAQTRITDGNGSFSNPLWGPATR